MSSSGQYFQYTWSWATNCSFGRTSKDQALVAVIDGGKNFSCLVMGVGLWVGLFEIELTIFYDYHHPYSHLAYLQT